MDQWLEEQFPELQGTLMLDPPNEGLLENGILSKDAQNACDAYFGQQLRLRALAFQLPEGLPHGTNRDAKWRVVSSLQKAIRHSDVEAAQMAAHAAFDYDEAYLFRRLGIIAVEDIGMANLPVLADVVAALALKAFRQSCDSRRLAVYLATQMALGRKDRSACSLLVTVDFDASLDKWKQAIMNAPDTQLGGVATDPSWDWQHRMTAAWMLAGTKRFWGNMMPRENDRPIGGFLRAMAENELPVLMLWLIHKAGSRLNDGLFVGLWPAWMMLQETDRSQMLVFEDKTIPNARVGRLLSSAYDIHTREGRTALMKFRKECKALHPFFDGVPKDQWQSLIGEGVFFAEGGRLTPELLYGESLSVKEQATKLALSHFSLPEDKHEDFLLTIREHLPELHVARKKVFYAAFGSS